jgi:myo-inositol-1(or 4)-monophosphatase
MTDARDLDALSARLLEVASEAALEAGDYVVGEAGRAAVAAVKQGFFDPVTECDRQSERMIAEHIFRRHSDSSLLGEEGGRQGEGAVAWYVDPIDGTNNFVSGIPFFCVSIGAALGDSMLAGVIYDPVRKEMFAASRAGAFLNGKPIRCTGGSADRTSTLLTSFPLSGGRANARDLDRFGRLLGSFRSVRRLGSAALNLAYVACGRADASFDEGISAWDVAAGLFILEQAGGRYFVPERAGLPAGQPWLSPNYVAVCPEFDLRQSVLTEVLWDGLAEQFRAATEVDKNLSP